MRIERLDLIAFGPFTDRSLVLEGGGLHLIHGPNEAGKSAALRGLKALLYGVPGNTRDAFVHDKPKLRIGGLLRNADGGELDFVRRKGRNNTLLDREGNALDERLLAPFLHGVGPELFETLFGIDHPALVRGGREILEQRGDLGQALFSAALGSHALHGVLEGLKAEAEALFKPRGSTPRINAAVKRYGELKKAIRERSLSSREWREHRQAWEQADTALSETTAGLRAARSESHRLKRIQRALPKLARRRQLQAALQELGEVVELGEDFPERRREILHERDKARTLLAKTRPRLQALQRQLDGLDANPAVAQRAGRIEALHSGLGAYLKALRDSPGLRMRQQQLKDDAEALMKTLLPDGAPADTLRQVLAKRQRIAELGQRQAVLQSRLEQAADSQREIEGSLQACARQLTALPPARSSEALRAAIAAARKLGDIDETIQSLRAERDTLGERCAALLSRLAPWPGGLDEVAGLATPESATLDDFERRQAELENEATRLRDRRSELAEQRRETARQLDELLHGGDVPSEADLLDARERRDQAWRRMRDQWAAGGALESAQGERFGRYIEAADELADRLRREADRVNRRASLQAERDSLDEALQALDRRLEASEKDRQRLADEWRALCASSGIPTLPPRELRAWIARLENLREQRERLRELEHRLAQRERQRAAAIQGLLARLRAFGVAAEASGDALEPLLQESEARARQADEEASRRAALEKERCSLQARLTTAAEAREQAAQALEQWRIEWRERLTALALPADSSPAEVDDIIEALRAAFDKQTEAGQLRQRLQAIEADGEAFIAEVAEVADAIDAGLAALPPKEAVERLNTLLSAEREAASRRREIEERIAEHRLDIHEAEAAHEALKRQLDDLCREAACDGPERLEQAERRSAGYRALRTELAALERELETIGEGLALAELEAQAEQTDADSLPATIEALDERIDALEHQRTGLAEARGREAKALELMDGSDRAAALAEQAQAVLAGIRADAEHYTRARLAETLLRERIEHYRRENQGPLLAQASDYFARLTLGSFERLIADFDAKDRPILTGVRANGASVTVDGMSAGTRDQLYLALRLASLERYMQAREAMPFIVDDILIEFDDQRSAAALRALAGIAGKTQVILFTHHEHVVEQARALQPAARIHAL